MYVVLEIENHTDRGVLNVFGPYQDFDAAWDAAKDMEDDPSNIVPGYGKLRSYFNPMEMTPDV